MALAALFLVHPPLWDFSRVERNPALTSVLGHSSGGPGAFHAAQTVVFQSYWTPRNIFVQLVFNIILDVGTNDVKDVLIKHVPHFRNYIYIAHQCKCLSQAHCCRNPVFYLLSALGTGQQVTFKLISRLYK